MEERKLSVGLIKNKSYLNEAKIKIKHIIRTFAPELLKVYKSIMIGGSLPFLCLSLATAEEIMDEIGDIDVYPTDYPKFRYYVVNPGPKVQIIPNYFENFLTDVLYSYDCSLCMVGYDISNDAFIISEEFLGSIRNNHFTYWYHNRKHDTQQRRLQKLISRADKFFNMTIEIEENNVQLINPATYIRCPKKYTGIPYVEYFSNLCICKYCGRTNQCSICTSCYYRYINRAFVIEEIKTEQNKKIPELSDKLLIGNENLCENIKYFYGKFIDAKDLDFTNICKMIANSKQVHLAIDIRKEFSEIINITDTIDRKKNLLQLSHKIQEYLMELFEEYLKNKNGEDMNRHNLVFLLAINEEYQPEILEERKLIIESIHALFELYHKALLSQRLAVTYTAIPTLLNTTEFDYIFASSEKLKHTKIQELLDQGVDSSFTKKIPIGTFMQSLFSAVENNDISTISLFSRMY